MSTHPRMQPADPLTNPVEGTDNWKWSTALVFGVLPVLYAWLALRTAP